MIFFVQQPVVVTTGEPVLSVLQTEHKWLGHNLD